MREILFRGKTLDTGEWVYGIAFPHDNNGAVTILFQHPLDGSLNGKEVDASTVSEFTGLVDSTGEKIFEGDVISKRFIRNFYVSYSVEDAEYLANFGDSYGSPCGSLSAYFNPKDSFVVGNIYDNPELVGE